MEGNVSDRELVEIVIGGNTGSYSWLVERHQNSILALLLKRFPRDTAETLLREIFVEAFVKLETLEENEMFSDWLRILALRCCHDYRLKKFSGKEEPLKLKTNEEKCLEHIVNVKCSSDFSFSNGMNDLREKVLAQLTPEERLLVECIYFENFSAKVMARVLRRSLAWIKIKTWKARHKMRQIMAKLIESGNIKREPDIKGILEYE